MIQMSESGFNPHLSTGMVVLGWVGEILAMCGHAMSELSEEKTFNHEELHRWRVANDVGRNLIRIEINSNQTSRIRENLVLLLQLNGFRVEECDNVLEVFMYE